MTDARFSAVPCPQCGWSPYHIGAETKCHRCIMDSANLHGQRDEPQPDADRMEEIRQRFTRITVYQFDSEYGPFYSFCRSFLRMPGKATVIYVPPGWSFKPEKTFGVALCNLNGVALDAGDVAIFATTSQYGFVIDRK
jgi:hypothetical protein